MTSYEPELQAAMDRLRRAGVSRDTMRQFPEAWRLAKTGDDVSQQYVNAAYTLATIGLIYKKDRSIYKRGPAA